MLKIPCIQKQISGMIWGTPPRKGISVSVTYLPGCRSSFFSCFPWANFLLLIPNWGGSLGQREVQHPPHPDAVWFLGSRRTRECSKNYLLIPVCKSNHLGILEVFVIAEKTSPASLSRSFAPYNKLSAPFRLGWFWCFPCLVQLCRAWQKLPLGVSGLGQAERI